MNKNTYKKYRCIECGHEMKQETNHYGNTWSVGTFNTCPTCPPYKKYPEYGGATIWECIEPKKGYKFLYHGTSTKNLDSIKEQGLKQFFEGIYLTDSSESAARWCGFKLIAQDQNEVAVLKVMVDEANLSPGMDHSPMMVKMFGVGESILHDGHIPNEQIIEVLTYKIGENKNA